MKKREEIVKEVNRYQERLDVLISLSADLIFEYDIPSDTMYYYNQSEKDRWKNARENYSVSILEGNTVHEDDYGILEEFCSQLKAGASPIQLELRRKYSDGLYHWIEVAAKSILDEAGRPEKVIGKFTIIDEKIRYRNTLVQRMERDMLTGLYNREAVKKLIEEKMEHNDFCKKSFLLVIDISEFRSAYEHKGSLFGDTVLCTFSDELQIQFPEGCAGRIGENEFVLYIENTTLAELKERKTQLCRRVQRIYTEGAEEIIVTSSIGVTAVHEKDTYDVLLLQAQSALRSETEQNKEIMKVYRKGKTPLLKSLSLTPIQKKERGSLYGSDGDLILFAVELFEKVPDIKSVLKVLSDRICRFYKIQDIVYLTHSTEGPLRMEYYWGSIVRGEFNEVYVSTNRSEWEILLKQHDVDGVSVLREKDIKRERETDGRSLLSIRLGSGANEHYMLFVDREKDREWKQELTSLKRLAWIIHKRLQQMESERREMERTNYIVEHDEKTDLYNYTKFLALAEQMVKSNRKKKYALIYSDFSNFQFLNETYGYVTGDKVLIDFANALKENSPNGVLYSRVAGDHFISMYEYTGGEALINRYVKMADAFCEQVNKKYNMCNLIMVSGMSIIDDPKTKIAVYVDNANIARKAVKKDTLVRCKIYSEDLRMVSKRQMDLAASMERALKNGEFVMYLQPKIELASGKISGAEALVRWVKPDGSLVYPDEFIPLFEKNRFITKIDFEMLRQVLKLQRTIMELGLPLIPISVNFSRRHQENDGYVEEVDRMMREYQVPSQYVEIEVTESVFMDDFTVLNQNISKLKKTGVGVAIDDFGSGYSSLNVLSKVNADVIKLDRQFLLDMENDNGEVKKNFLNTLILMIKQLGFKVLAEGVETAEQEELLKNTGCEFAQGYLYAKPMRVMEFMDFTKKYKKTY